MRTTNKNPHRAKRPRFRIERLEERIAPTCRLNPQGKWVGCKHDCGHAC